MKYKKYILGLMFGLLVLVGGGVSASAYSGSVTYTAPNVIINVEAGTYAWVYTMDGQAYDNRATLTDTYTNLGWSLGDYQYVVAGQTPPDSTACGVDYSSCSAVLGSVVGTFTITAGVIPPPAGTGISFFKSGGTYQASNMIGQTATALQSTMGLNGIGSMLAIVAGISMALMIGLWISDIFGEAKKGLKEVDKKKE
jgi:hypothetical protein